MDLSARRQRTGPAGGAVVAGRRNETAVQISTEWYWLYAVVNLDSLYLLDIDVSSHHGTDPAAVFLHGLAEKYDVAEVASSLDERVKIDRQR